MTLELIVSPEAEAQIEIIDSWWRANRLAAPDLFERIVQDNENRIVEAWNEYFGT